MQINMTKKETLEYLLNVARAEGAIAATKKAARDAKKGSQQRVGRRRPLTEETIRRIVSKMPGGLSAFCAQWGWLTFARRIERAHRIN